MKNIFLIVIILSISIIAFTQENSLDKLLYKKGVYQKQETYDLLGINGKYNAMDMDIVKVSQSGVSIYFLRLSYDYPSKGTFVNVIEYTELLDILRSAKQLKVDSEKEIHVSKPDDTQSSYKTLDGLELGYFIDYKQVDKSPIWFIKISYSIRDALFIVKDFATVESSLNRAKQKIEEVKVLK